MKEIYYYMHYFHFYDIIYEQLLSQVNPLDRRSIMRVFILPTVLQKVIMLWFFGGFCCCLFLLLLLLLFYDDNSRAELSGFTINKKSI